MNFNHPLRGPTTRPSGIVKHGSIAERIGLEGPPAGNSLTRGNPPSLLRSVITDASGPQSQGKFSVVPSTSPQGQAYRKVDVRGDDLVNPIVSDLLSKTKQGAPSSNPTTTAPAAKLSPKQQNGPSASASIPRGRGRPKGSKLQMGHPGAGGKVAATAAASRQARQIKTVPSMNGYKRRGRPPKLPSPPPKEIYYQTGASFLAFRCEWRGCKAELHNLETLRRHVYIIHGRELLRTCLWGKCASMPGTIPSVNENDLETHMETAHLVPFAWHVGDGPRNDGQWKRDEDEIPDFLKDRNGVQVTPSVRDQQVEDFITWRNNRKKLKELLIRRDENLPDEDEDGACGVMDENGSY